MGWAAARPERTWAIEGATGLGHLLARQLVPAGEQMLDIQPKVAGRVRLRGLASTGHRMSGSVPPPTVSISLSPRRIVGVMGDLSISVRFRSSRRVIPGLAAGVAGRAADQVGDRRRPVFGPRAGTPGPGRRRDG